MCTRNTSKTKSVKLFPLGQVVATPGALEALEALDRAAINAADLIPRHQSGDWGNVPPSDLHSDAH